MGFFCYTEEEFEAWINGKAKDNGFFDHMIECRQCAILVDNFYLNLVKANYLLPKDEEEEEEED